MTATPGLMLCPKHAPVTLPHLMALRDILDLTNTFDAAVFATTTVAFWCQCHMAEVLIDTIFNSLFHASHATQQKSGWTASKIKYHSFWAPSTKTSLHGEAIRWINSGYGSSADWAFQNHWKVSSHVPPWVICLALKWLQDPWSQCAGLGSWTGAMKCGWPIIWECLQAIAFRIGGTTHLLLLGVDPCIVMAHTCFSHILTLKAYFNMCP